MGRMDTRFLVLDDDEATARAIAALLLGMGHEVVHTCTDGREAAELARRRAVDLALLDISLRGGPREGIDVGATLRGLGVPVVYLTGHDDAETLECALDTDPYGFILKPTSAASLRASIRIALHRHRLERRLSESEARYRALFQNSFAGVARSTLDGQILEVNPAFARILKFEGPEQLAGASLDSIFLSREDFERMYAQLRGETGAWSEEVALCGGDGERVSVHKSTSLVNDPASKRPTLISIIIDTSRQQELARRLERIAYTDGLTGLPNRRLLEKQAERILALADRHRGRVGLLYLDISGFKAVNDRLGHAAGDGLLEEAARRIEDGARDSDVVARIGGDEFAVLLSEVAGPDAAVIAADRIAGAFEEPFTVNGESVTVGLRVGVALYPEHAADFGGLLMLADQAMYGVQGPHGAALYAPPEDVENGAFHRAVAEAFHTGALDLAFQPIFSADREEAVGAEAFLRWPRSLRDTLPASKLLPALERNGLLARLDEWAFRESIRWLKGQEGAGRPGWVAVNVSLASLAETGLADRLERVMSEEGVAPENVQLEFGNVPGENGAGCLKELRELRRRGVRIALEGPWEVLEAGALETADILKLDGRLIQNLGRSPERAALAAAVIGTARAAGLELMASRIERPEQLEWVRRHRIQYFQGFLWGSPTPAREFAAAASSAGWSGVHPAAVESGGLLPGPEDRRLNLLRRNLRVRHQLE